MNIFTVAELFDWFKSIFSYCGTSLLKMNDEDMMYYLFEELPGDAISCLHENTLQKLKKHGYIDSQTFLLCQMLRARYIELDALKNWSADEIRRDERWGDLMRLGNMIYNKIIDLQQRKPK